MGIWKMRFNEVHAWIISSNDKQWLTSARNIYKSYNLTSLGRLLQCAILAIKNIFSTTKLKVC